MAVASKILYFFVDVLRHIWQLYKLGFWMLCLVLLSSYQPLPTLVEKIQDEGILRVAMRNAPTVYYTGAEGNTGYEYELVKRFGDYLGVELDILLPENFNDILPSLNRGQVHMAAAGLSVTDERKAQFRFGPSIDTAIPQVVYKRGQGKPRKIEDILDSEIAVVTGSSHEELLRNLAKEHPELKWTSYDEKDDSDLLYEVTTKKHRFTVADSNVVKVNARHNPNISVGFDLGKPHAIAWAFRQRNDGSLYSAAYDFIEFLEETGDLERIRYQYFAAPKRLAEPAGALRYQKKIRTTLPKYKKWFQDAALKTAFDWRLLAAVGYQESNWNPSAVSPTGVLGIMMLTKRAASEVDVRDRLNPQQSILGGAKYLRQMYRRVPKYTPDMSHNDRLWMTLAAYNVGLGHLFDAQRLTEAEGDSPAIWIDVKERLKRLNERKWHKKTRHGFALGREAVSYVENIRGYYEVLVWKTTPQELRTTPPEALKLNPQHSQPDIDNKTNDDEAGHNIENLDEMDWQRIPSSI